MYTRGEYHHVVWEARGSEWQVKRNHLVKDARGATNSGGWGGSRWGRHVVKKVHGQRNHVVERACSKGRHVVGKPRAGEGMCRGPEDGSTRGGGRTRNCGYIWVRERARGLTRISVKHPHTLQWTL